MSVPSDVIYRPKTPSRAIRIDEELWADALWAADVNEENVSLVVRRDLKAYVEKTKREHPEKWARAEEDL